MGSKKAKRRRRITGKRSEADRNADYAIAAARRVLSADLMSIPLTRVTQFVIGWMRAAFDQSLVIATLTKGNLARAASPNRRLFVEVMVRLQWLHTVKQGDRVGAVDAMIDNERELTKTALKHLADMGFESQRDLSDMRDLVLNAADGTVKNQARQFLAAAKSTDGLSVGPYYAWREETQNAHASGAMAVAYAPAVEGEGYPSVADPDLTVHVYVLMALVGLAYRLLVEEGVEPSVAQVVIDAFLGESE